MYIFVLTWKTSLEAQSISRCAGYSTPSTTRQISFIRRSAYSVAIFNKTVRELSTWNQDVNKDCIMIAFRFHVILNIYLYRI